MSSLDFGPWTFAQQLATLLEDKGQLRQEGSIPLACFHFPCYKPQSRKTVKAFGGQIKCKIQENSCVPSYFFIFVWEMQAFPMLPAIAK